MEVMSAIDLDEAALHVAALAALASLQIPWHQGRCTCYRIELPRRKLWAPNHDIDLVRYHNASVGLSECAHPVAAHRALLRVAPLPHIYQG